MGDKDLALIEKEIRQIISEWLEIKEEIIKSESKLSDDLGIDSFGFVELVFEVKDKYGVEITDQDSKSMARVKDVVNYIYTKTKEN